MSNVLAALHTLNRLACARVSGLDMSPVDVCACAQNALGLGSSSSSGESSRTPGVTTSRAGAAVAHQSSPGGNVKAAPSGSTSGSSTTDASQVTWQAGSRQRIAVAAYSHEACDVPSHPKSTAVRELIRESLHPVHWECIYSSLVGSAFQPITYYHRFPNIPTASKTHLAQV
jgi:hypothetical protein